MSEQKKVEDILANLNRLLEEGVEEESGSEEANPADRALDDPVIFQPARAVDVEGSSPEPQELIDEAVPQLDHETEEEKPRPRILLTEEMLVEDRQDRNNVTD